jgi:hypothetical protein
VAQQSLPPSNQPWVDPKTGNPTQQFYQFMTSAFPFGVDLQARILRINPLTYSQLPKPFRDGMVASIGDSRANIPGAIIAGSGQFHVLGYYNSTLANWIVL